MTTFPEIEGARLILNQLQLGDIDQITKYCQNPNVSKFLVNMPSSYTKADAEWWIKNSWEKFKLGSQYTFAIRRKDDSCLVGGIGLILSSIHQNINIGYWLGEEHWNKGYMSEALNLAIEFAITNLKVHKVYASHF